MAACVFQQAPRGVDTMENRTGRFVTGGLLIAVGLQMLGEQSGWWEAGWLWRLWPVALVAVGLRRGAAGADGILWIGYGLVLVLWTTGVWLLRDSWPLLLVLHGVVILTGRRCGPGRNKPGRQELHVG